MKDIKDMDMEDMEMSEMNMPMMKCPMMHLGMMQCPMMQMFPMGGGMPMQQYMMKTGYMDGYDMKDWYEYDDSDYDSDDKEEYYYKPKKKRGIYRPPYQHYYKR